MKRRVVSRIWRLLPTAAVLAVVALAGCATVGVDRESVRSRGDGAFDQALIDYAVGDLDAAQAGTLVALETNPLDARATDLLRAILKEKDLLDTLDRAPPVELPEFAPQSPAELARIVRGRSPQVREAVFGVIEARAELREANVDVGPELTLLTRFYPLGILARMTQSLYGGWWERKAKMHEAEAAVIEALADYGHAVESVNREALIAYVNAAAAEEQLRSLERERSLLEEELDQASLLVSDGLTLPRTPLVTRSEIGSLVHLRSVAQQQLATSKARLNGLMNRPPSAPIAIAATGVAWQPADSVEAALTAAYANRFEIDEAEARIKTAEARKELTGTGTPDVDLYASYGESGENNETRFIKGFTIGAITRLPLAIVPLKKARSDRDAAVIRQLEFREQQVRHEIAVEVVDAYHGWEAAMAEFASERDGLALANEDRRVAIAERVSEADTDPMALGRANIGYVRARRAVLQRKFDVQRSLIELGTSVGADTGSMHFSGTRPRGNWSANVLINPDSGGTRALWVWRKRFLRDETETNFFLDFLRARRIRTVFLFVNDGDLETGTPRLANFLRLAHDAGVAIQALNGEHDWLRPDRHAAARRFVERIIGFNAQHPQESRFSAVHLDIEPHALADWSDDANKEKLLFQYIGLLDELRDLRADVPLVVDIPLWFADRDIDGIALSNVVMRRVDGVALMAYSGGAARQQTLLQRVARSASATPASFWAGVSADHAHLCAGTRAEGFEETMRSIESQLGGQRKFSGVAIHELDRYRDLLLGTGPRGGGTRQCLQAAGKPAVRG